MFLRLQTVGFPKTLTEPDGPRTRRGAQTPTSTSVPSEPTLECKTFPEHNPLTNRIEGYVDTYVRPGRLRVWVVQKTIESRAGWVVLIVLI